MKYHMLFRGLILMWVCVMRFASSSQLTCGEIKTVYSAAGCCGQYDSPTCLAAFNTTDYKNLEARVAQLEMITGGLSESLLADIIELINMTSVGP